MQTQRAGSRIFLSIQALWLLAIVVLAAWYFVDPPAGTMLGVTEIMAVFAVIMCVIGLLAGAGLPWMLHLSLMLLLGSLFPCMALLRSWPHGVWWIAAFLLVPLFMSKMGRLLLSRTHSKPIF